MKNHEKSETITKAIAANIEALAELLEDAMVSACEAQEAMSKNEQNQAIGGILDLDRKLEDALALYRAAVALHRKGGA
ncbi:MAG: hypothetical protein IT160_17610 [Bryobacterales bacterium]|nr:hypothetical protein [Bryobacterales bacterium]